MAGVLWLLASREPSSAAAHQPATRPRGSAGDAVSRVASPRCAAAGRVARGNFTPRPPQNHTCTSPRMRLLSADARPPSLRISGCTRDRGPPACGCPGPPSRLRWPLRSSPITGPSSLLLATPPLCAALVLSRSRFCRLRVSLCIGTTGSQVPHKSPDCVLAAFMPDADRTARRLPPALVPEQRSRPGFDII